MSKVSVIIPTYQSACTIKEAINSVLKQTYKDYEIIVIDDESTDETQVILRSYGAQIRLINQSHGGVFCARNKGISASKGDYIAFLDSDDQWLPNKLELQVKFLESHPQVALLFTNAIITTGLPSIDKGTNKPTLFDFRKPCSGKVFIDLFRKNFIATSTVMVRKKCLQKAGFFDNTLDFGLSMSEDHYMWLRISEFFDVAYIDMPLAVAYMPAWQSERRDNLRLQMCNLQLKKKILSRNPHLLKILDSKALDEGYYQLYLRLGMLHILKGKIKKAKRNFEKYLGSYPRRWYVYFLYLFTMLPVAIALNLRDLVRKALERRPFSFIRLTVFDHLFFVYYNRLWYTTFHMNPNARICGEKVCK